MEAPPRPSSIRMTDLPAELIAHTLHFLDDESLATAVPTCRAFRESLSPSLWRTRLRCRFPHSSWVSCGAPCATLAALGSLRKTAWQEATRADGKPPSDRGGHSCVGLRGGQWQFVFGGANGDALFGDSFLLIAPGANQGRFRWQPLGLCGGPVSRWAHTAVAWSDTVAILYGGHAGVHGALGDVWALDASSPDPAALRWAPPDAVRSTGGVPPPRYGHAACARGDSMWVSGGIVGGFFDAQAASDLYEAVVTRTGDRRGSGIGGSAHGGRHGGGGSVALELSWRERRPQGKPPDARFGHSLVSAAGALWMFGGRTQPHHAPMLLEVCSTLHVLRGLDRIVSGGGGGGGGGLSPASPAPSSWLSSGLGPSSPSTAHPSTASPIASTVSTASPGSPDHHHHHHHHYQYHLDGLPPMGNAAPHSPTFAPGSPGSPGSPGLDGALRWEEVRTGGPLPPPRAFHASTALGDTLLIMGGEGGLPSDAEEIAYLNDIYTLPLGAAHDGNAPRGGAAGGGAHGDGDGDGGGDGDGVASLRWQRLQPHAADGAPLAPASSLAAVCLIDAHLLVFGGFNTTTEADLGELYLLSLCPHLGPLGRSDDGCSSGSDGGGSDGGGVVGCSEGESSSRDGCSDEGSSVDEGGGRGGSGGGGGGGGGGGDEAHDEGEGAVGSGVRSDEAGSVLS